MKTIEALTHVPDGLPLKTALQRTTHLAIGAHQDDLEIFAYHGIAACYKQEDLWFGGITVTDGGGSSRTGPYADTTDEEMKDVRHREQDAAADIGRYSFQSQLNVPSGVVKKRQESEALVETLVEILRACRPETLYLHNPADKHPTHLAVLTRCIEAIRMLLPDEQPNHIYGCEVWRDLDWLRDESKIALPVHRYPELAKQLLEVFDSQIVGGKDYVNATIGRRRANATYYASHAVDTGSAYTFAMDLRPLVEHPGLTLEILVDRHIHQFRADVTSAYSQLVS